MERMGGDGSVQHPVSSQSPQPASKPKEIPIRLAEWQTTCAVSTMARKGVRPIGLEQGPNSIAMIKVAWHSCENLIRETEGEEQKDWIVLRDQYLDLLVHRTFLEEASRRILTAVADSSNADYVHEAVGKEMQEFKRESLKTLDEKGFLSLIGGYTAVPSGHDVFMQIRKTSSGKYECLIYNRGAGTEQMPSSESLVAPVLSLPEITREQLEASDFFYYLVEFQLPIGLIRSDSGVLQTTPLKHTSDRWLAVMMRAWSGIREDGEYARVDSSIQRVQHKQEGETCTLRTTLAVLENFFHGDPEKARRLKKKLKWKMSLSSTQKCMESLDKVHFSSQMLRSAQHVLANSFSKTKEHLSAKEQQEAQALLANMSDQIVALEQEERVRCLDQQRMDQTPLREIATESKPVLFSAQAQPLLLQSPTTTLSISRLSSKELVANLDQSMAHLEKLAESQEREVFLDELYAFTSKLPPEHKFSAAQVEKALALFRRLNEKNLADLDQRESLLARMRLPMFHFLMLIYRSISADAPSGALKNFASKQEELWGQVIKKWAKGMPGQIPSEEAFLRAIGPVTDARVGVRDPIMVTLNQETSSLLKEGLPIEDPLLVFFNEAIQENVLSPEFIAEVTKKPMFSTVPPTSYELTAALSGENPLKSLPKPYADLAELFSCSRWLLCGNAVESSTKVEYRTPNGTRVVTTYSLKDGQQELYKKRERDYGLHEECYLWPDERSAAFFRKVLNPDRSANPNALLAHDFSAEVPREWVSVARDLAGIRITPLATLPNTLVLFESHPDYWSSSLFQSLFESLLWTVNPETRIPILSGEIEANSPLMHRVIEYLYATHKGIGQTDVSIQLSIFRCLMQVFARVPSSHPVYGKISGMLEEMWGDLEKKSEGDKEQRQLFHGVMVSLFRYSEIHPQWQQRVQNAYIALGGQSFDFGAKVRLQSDYRYACASMSLGTLAQEMKVIPEWITRHAAWPCRSRQPTVQSVEKKEETVGAYWIWTTKVKTSMIFSFEEDGVSYQVIIEQDLRVKDAPHEARILRKGRDGTGKEVWWQREMGNVELLPYTKKGAWTGAVLWSRVEGKEAVVVGPDHRVLAKLSGELLMHPKEPGLHLQRVQPKEGISSYIASLLAFAGGENVLFWCDERGELMRVEIPLYDLTLIRNPDGTFASPRFPDHTVHFDRSVEGMDGYKHYCVFEPKSSEGEAFMWVTDQKVEEREVSFSKTAPELHLSEKPQFFTVPLKKEKESSFYAYRILSPKAPEVLLYLLHLDLRAQRYSQARQRLDVLALHREKWSDKARELLEKAMIAKFSWKNLL